jgi:midasin (ATPase involved in ribosome maturation)
LEKELVGNPVKGTAQKIKKIKSEHSKLIDEIMTIRNETLERINGLLTKKDTTQVF